MITSRGQRGKGFSGLTSRKIPPRSGQVGMLRWGAVDGHSLLVRETERMKRALVERVLKKHNGVRARAARELQIESSHLRRLIKKWGLK